VTDDIGSNERAALINLYSQYDYTEETYTNHELDERRHIKDMNARGRAGWKVIDMAWSDEGVSITYERPYFNRDYALERVRTSRV
jgi:hypothetical protein